MHPHNSMMVELWNSATSVLIARGLEKWHQRNCEAGRLCPSRPKKCRSSALIVRTQPAYIARNCASARRKCGANHGVQG